MADERIMGVDQISEIEFLKIGITLPQSGVREEARRIIAMLDNGIVDRFHIRKDDDAEALALVESIPARLHRQLSLHRVAPPQGSEVWRHAHGGESCSCHTIAESEEMAHLYPETRYIFLSPVFDSISKPGYEAVSFPADRLARLKVCPVALGGVTAERFEECRRLGFRGGAMLGSLWREVKSESSIQIAAQWNGALQLITDAPTVEGSVRQAALALEGGCRWVQIRMKDAADADVRDAALQTAEIIRDRFSGERCTLIVDDRVEVVKELIAELQSVDHLSIGVHLGKNDMCPREAREILGGNAIIGATVNTLQDVERVSGMSVDYLGMGPYRFTSTKRKLAPVLGLGGYQRIMSAIRAGGCSCPVVAIGGVTQDDVVPLIEAGVSGVAVSGAINKAPDPVKATVNFIEILKLFKLICET